MKIKVIVDDISFMHVGVKENGLITLATTTSLYVSNPYAEVLKKHTVNGVVTRYRQVNINSCVIPFGVYVQLPKGYEGAVILKDNVFRRFGLIQASIKYSNFNYEELTVSVIATQDAIIPQESDIAYLKIQLSQNATIWQKIKWLFSKSISIQPIVDKRLKQN